VWPRGVSKEKLKLDEWFKDIGPSKDLRQWFDHDPDKFDEFKQKYHKELQDGDQKASYDKLKQIQKENNKITLVFASKDEEQKQEDEQKETYDKHKQNQKENNTITLVFASKDEEHNQAQVLKEMLEN